MVCELAVALKFVLHIHSSFAWRPRMWRRLRGEESPRGHIKVKLSPCLEMAGVDVVIMHAAAAWCASARGRTSVVKGTGLITHAALVSAACPMLLITSHAATLALYS